MKLHIATTINEYLKENINLKDAFKPHLIDNKYLFHYTLAENLDNIMKEGLIPRKEPNSYYKDGANGIFLTTSRSLYKANLPQTLMDEQNEYYESLGDDDEVDITDRPIVRLWVDITTLDFEKFTYDDDYILNKYNYNKAENEKEKVIESLEIWSSVAYLDKIPLSSIDKYDFDYSA